MRHGPRSVRINPIEGVNMKRLAILAVLAVAANALADETVRTGLTGFEEVPVVSTNASGRFEAKIARDHLSITYTLTYSALQGQVRQAHIHVAQKNVNGGIVVWLCGSTQNPGPTGTQTCPQSGAVSGTIAPADVQAVGTQQVAAGDLQEVIDALRAGLAYVNVHTDLSPGGEIRGQVDNHSGHY
jgi:hypothetical protein